MSGSTSKPADGSPHTGQEVGRRYRLIQKLAKGGMGSVWEAQDQQLERAVAIKFMAAHIADDEVLRERFTREAKAAARLRTPHVVQIFEYGVEDNLPYIVMELLEGEDLHTRLRRKRRLPHAEAAEILRQAARGLRVAHQSNVIHRDLKPQNIFLADEDGEMVVKILDFGVAKVTDLAGDGTKTGAVLGSPHYMSPEQARGRTIDARSDVWALGAIAFRMTVGKMPFAGSATGDVIVRICSDPIPIASEKAPGLAPAFDAFFLRALEREVAKRFQSVEELAEAYADLAEHATAPASTDAAEAEAGEVGSGSHISGSGSHISGSGSGSHVSPARPSGDYVSAAGYASGVSASGPSASGVSPSGLQAARESVPSGDRPSGDVAAFAEPSNPAAAAGAVPPPPGLDLQAEPDDGVGETVALPSGSSEMAVGDAAMVAEPAHAEAAGESYGGIVNNPVYAPSPPKSRRTITVVAAVAAVLVIAIVTIGLAGSSDEPTADAPADGVDNPAAQATPPAPPSQNDAQNEAQNEAQDESDAAGTTATAADESDGDADGKATDEPEPAPTADDPEPAADASPSPKPKPRPHGRPVGPAPPPPPSNDWGY